MAQYYTDFSAALTAVDRTWSLEHLEPTENPDGMGFSDAWVTGRWTVQEVDEETVIQHRTAGSTSFRCALLWPSAGMFADVEALCCVYVDTSTTGKRPGVVLRASGVAAAESGYAFVARKSGNVVAIDKYVSGAYSTLTSAAYTFSTGWYWIRARAEGTDLYMRLWADGDSEPATWTLSTTDAANAHGFVGVFDFEGSYRISYFKALRVTGTPLHQADWRWGWGEVGHALPHVIADAGCEGGKALYMEQDSSDARRLFVWDEVEPADEIRVLARFKPSAIHVGLHPFRVRAGGYGGSETGYTIRPTAALTGVEVYSYWRGDGQAFGSGACDWAAGEWHMVRFQVVGKSFKVKVWLDADPEPASWSLEVDDPDSWGLGLSHQTLGQKGWFGLGSHHASTSILWDWIAIGTDGDNVP